ncbi:hypothetical protein LUZ60_016803 [Juncus effusus]|nr:hypothetical protein LUZ60_016803 [Juncus effusus]
MPNTFPLIAVQRQTAASRLTSPSRRGQQVVVGGVPTLSPLIKFKTSAQTPNFSASIGQLPEPPEGVLGLGVGVGLGQPLPHAEVRVKERRLKARKRARNVVDLAAIVGGFD